MILGHIVMALWCQNLELATLGFIFHVRPTGERCKAYHVLTRLHSIARANGTPISHEQFCRRTAGAEVSYSKPSLQ